MDTHLEWGKYLFNPLPILPSTLTCAHLSDTLVQNTSVGRFAIQLAKFSGLKVATTASPKNWDRLKDLGADLIVDYKASSLQKQ